MHGLSLGYLLGGLVYGSMVCNSARWSLMIVQHWCILEPRSSLLHHSESTTSDVRFLQR